MNTQPASTIYLIDYLAHHREYIEEVTQYKINHWLPTSPDRSYGVWFSEIEESAQKDVPPLTFVALMETGAETRELAGFVTLIEIDEQAGIEKGLWMITLYVKSEYRQQGIGKHLMQRCIMEGKRLGYPALYLWTENKELTSFYAKRGWKVISKEEESGDGIMGIKLNS